MSVDQFEVLLAPSPLKSYNSFRMEDCVFCKIIKGEIPAEVVCQDTAVMAFKDITPQAPVHYIFVPKEHVGDFLDADDETVLAIKNRILDKVRELKLAEKGYRLVVNGGAAKAVPHLHVHLLGEVSVKREV